MATVLLAVIYALVHSALASRQAKDGFERIAGARARNGLYRPFFIGQAVITTIGALLIFRRLPDRDLYRAPPPWSGLLRLVQLASLALLASAVKVVGIQRLTGWKQISAYVRGEFPEREPEAQGPPPTRERQPDAPRPLPLNPPSGQSPNHHPPLEFPADDREPKDARLRVSFGKPFEGYARRTPLFIPRQSAIGSSRMSGAADAATI